MTAPDLSALSGTAYHVEEAPGSACPRCDHGRLWEVIDPDGVAGGASYGDVIDAEEECAALNDAYQQGREYERKQTAATTAERPGTQAGGDGAEPSTPPAPDVRAAVIEEADMTFVESFLEQPLADQFPTVARLVRQQYGTFGYQGYEVVEEATRAYKVIEQLSAAIRALGGKR